MLLQVSDVELSLNKTIALAFSAGLAFLGLFGAIASWALNRIAIGLGLLLNWLSVLNFGSNFFRLIKNLQV
jgi:hypothetical protein